MVIPKFYRWLSERYPLINQRIAGRVGPEFDNLYIDLNPIITRCCNESSSASLSISAIFNEICKIVQLVKPKKVLYLSIDGVSPNAKYNKIRQETFLNAFNNSMESKMEKEENNPGRFDANCIMPGTLWMDKLNREIELFIRRQITENIIWKRLTIIYDDYLSPQEASHKIMNWIRREKSNNDCDANIRHCLYGLDTKYIVMALVLHEIHFCLMCSQLLFGTQYKERLNNDSDSNNNDESYQLLHISILREYLNIEFNIRTNINNRYNIENIVDDFVLLIVLKENQYLPSIPSLDMEALLESYKQILTTFPMDEYIVNKGEINFHLLHKLFLNLAQKEGQLLSNVYEVLIRHYHRLSGYTYTDDADKELIFPTDGIENTVETCMDIKEMTENLNLLKDGQQQYMDRYYMQRFGETRELQKPKLCNDYLKTLEWILKYYYFGCMSWSWSYKYHYAPFITDLLDLTNQSKNKLHFVFNVGTPLTPFEELMVVLPSESHMNLMPEYCFQFISDEKFKTCGMNDLLYPNKYIIDTNYHLIAANSVLVPLLPFINIHTFKLLLAQINQEKKDKNMKLPLTDKESQRNMLYTARIFRYDREKANESLKLHGPLSFGIFDDVVSCIRNNANINYNQHKFVPRPLKGARFIIPGFPKLKYFNYTSSIKQIGLRAFGFESLYKTLVLKHIREEDQNREELEEYAALLGNKLSVFIDWPYFIEAKVFYVETRKYIYQQYNKTQHTNFEMFNFDQRCLRLSDQFLRLKGVDVGVVHCLVHCFPLTSMFRQENRMKIIKKFSNKYISIPMQMVWTQDKLTNFNYFDSRFMDQKVDKKLELRIGSDVMYIGGLHATLFGCVGRITSQTRNGTINIAVLPSNIHGNNVNKIKDIINKFKPNKTINVNINRWHSLADASELINVQKIVLKRILEHIFVIHQNKKIQIGLKLFNFKKRLIVQGYTRIHKKYAELYIDKNANEDKKRIKRRKPRYVFEISAKALHIVMEYRSKFPGVFRVIQQKPSLVTFGSHYFAPDQIPTNFNPYIVSRVVGVSPNGLSSNFQNILDSLNEIEQKTNNNSDNDENNSDTNNVNDNNAAHALDHSSAVSNKWKRDLIEPVLPKTADNDMTQKVDANILSIRDAFKAKIHAVAANNTDIHIVNESENNDEEDEDAKNKEKEIKNGGLRYVVQVQHWLHRLDINKLGLVDANSIVVPIEALTEIEEEINKFRAGKPQQYIRLEKVEIHDVYASDPKVAWSPTPQRLWKLGDKCCSLRSDSSVPFGATGTVIGIHSSFLEILMDKECICGTDLCHKVSHLKGIKLAYDNVLNITTSFHSYSHHDLIPIDQFPKCQNIASAVNTYPSYGNTSYQRHRNNNNYTSQYNNNNNNLYSNRDKRGGDRVYYKYKSVDNDNNKGRNNNNYRRNNNNNHSKYRHHHYSQRYSNNNNNQPKYRQSQKNHNHHNNNNKSNNVSNNNVSNNNEQQQILLTDNRNRHRTSPVYGSVNQNNRNRAQTQTQRQTQPQQNNDIMKFQQFQNFIVQQAHYTAPDNYIEKNNNLNSNVE